jgi:hypothetical protein
MFAEAGIVYTAKTYGFFSTTDLMMSSLRNNWPINTLPHHHTTPPVFMHTLTFAEQKTTTHIPFS